MAFFLQENCEMKEQVQEEKGYRVHSLPVLLLPHSILLPTVTGSPSPQSACSCCSMEDSAQSRELCWCDSPVSYPPCLVRGRMHLLISELSTCSQLTTSWSISHEWNTTIPHLLIHGTEIGCGDHTPSHGRVSPILSTQV